MEHMTEQPRIIRFIYKSPLVIAGIVSYSFAVFMSFKFREDTSNITNAGFAIMATLAALSFSFARVIESDELKDRIMFAGERLLHGAILTLISSILKYFVLLLLKIPLFSSLEIVALIIILAISMLATLIFAQGIMFAHTGLRVLNDLLLLRFTRHKDWDDMW